MISGRAKFGIILLTFGVFAAYLVYLARDLWKQPVSVKPPPTGSINSNVESETNAVPMYVQSGTLEIGKPDDLSSYNLVTYRFGERQPGERPLRDEEGEAHGIFVFREQRLKKIEDLQQLKNGDFIYATFYKTPAWSDSGKKGETLLGVINNINHSGNVLKFQFVDDPSGRTYTLNRSTELLTEATGGLFDFGADVFGNLNKGSVLRILFDDNQRILQATVLAPPTAVSSGTIESIFPTEDGAKLEVTGDAKHYFVDQNTKIVKRGEPNTKKDLLDLKTSMRVGFVFYNHFSKYQVLSLDYLEK